MATELNDAEDQKLWPPWMEKLFIDIMVKECIKGNMPDGVFKSSTWNKLVTELKVVRNDPLIINKSRQNPVGSEQSTVFFLNSLNILRWDGIQWPTLSLQVMKFGKISIEQTFVSSLRICMTCMSLSPQGHSTIPTIFFVDMLPLNWYHQMWYKYHYMWC